MQATNKMKTEIGLLIICFILFAGCIQPSGCVPVAIQDKQITSSNGLMVEINGEYYHYYNPTLGTYSNLIINQTTNIRFYPMIGSNQYVELCK
jgi:hypothetical protein